jgi:hypothetical protein
MIQHLKALKTNIWLVISESWSDDCAELVPVHWMASESKGKIDLKIVLRDENEIGLFFNQ